MNVKKLHFSLMLILSFFINCSLVHANKSVIPADIEYFSDDQIIHQLVVAGCEERAVKQLIKAIDTSLEARNNSDDEEQEEREWRSAVIKYGLIATVSVVGIIWLIQMYKNRQHNQQQNQQPAAVAPHIQQAPVVAPQAPQQPNGQVPAILPAAGGLEASTLVVQITGANNLAPEQIAQAQALFNREFAVDNNEGRSLDVVRRTFPDTRFDTEHRRDATDRTPTQVLFRGEWGRNRGIGSWNEVGATYQGEERPHVVVQEPPIMVGGENPLAAAELNEARIMFNQRLLNAPGVQNALNAAGQGEVQRQGAEHETRVLFGRGAPLTAAELNEAQTILNQQLQRAPGLEDVVNAVRQRFPDTEFDFVGPQWRNRPNNTERMVSWNTVRMLERDLFF